MPCEIVLLNRTACRVDYQARDQERWTVFPGERLNVIIPGGLPMAKAVHQHGSDGEGRKLGERSGLDTRVVLAVNAACEMLHNLRDCAVS